MAAKYRMLILFAVSLIATVLVYMPILKIAKEKNVVDNPNARKLQRIPIPVLGGAAVLFGIVVGLCFFKTMLSFTSLFAVLGAMVVMLYVGMIDDILNIRPLTRLIIEVIVMTLMIYGTHYSMCNFQGLWGIDLLPTWLSVPFSVFVMIGIINAINMIDGVDGMLSGYCIVACTLFGLVFFLEHQFSFAALAAVTVGALIPFFIHNVFGKTTKMFMGDGGSMMLGTVISSMAIALCKYRVEYDEFIDEQFGVLAFTLAVLSLPIFDTLRVMAVRIFKGQSPFHPDKNHLHHIFIELGFSHIATTISEILLCLFVVAVWAVCWRLGAPVDIQLYAVIAAGMLVTFGLAALLKCRVKRKAKMPLALLALCLMLFASCNPVVPDPDDNESKKDTVPQKATCLAVFGDLQEASQVDTNAVFYRNSLEWLKERQLTKGDLTCIIHTGDCTNGNKGHMWRRFHKSTAIIASMVPFYSSTGNHDYECDDNFKIYDRRQTGIMDYLDFDPAFDNCVAQFENRRLENAVFYNAMGGERVDVMMLEFAPRADVLQWADAYLKEHKDRKFIVVTHEFLGVDGNIITENTHAEKHFKGTGLSASKPQETWDKLIAPNDNALCLVCGHVRKFAGYAELTNNAGRQVPIVEFNLQVLPHGSDGWVMLWDAEPGCDSVTVSIYNTVEKEFYNGSEVFTKFKFR